MSAKIFWTIVITGGLGGALAAQAQVSSPFAAKKKKQAWETQDVAPAPQVQTPPVIQQNFNSAPLQQSYNNPPSSSSQYYQAPAVQAPAAQNAPLVNNASRSPFAPKTPTRYQNTTPSSLAYPTSNYQGQNFQSQGFQGQSFQGQAYSRQNYPSQNYQGQNYPNGAANTAQNGIYGPGQIGQPAPPRSWKDRLGLGNIATSLKGFLKLGAAAVRRENDGTQQNEWDDGYIADGQIRGEVSAITQGGLEYGVGGLGIALQTWPDAPVLTWQELQQRFVDIHHAFIRQGQVTLVKLILP